MTKTATRVERKSRKQSTSVLEPTTPIATMGDATTAIFLLSDYEKFGLSERVCYHFDLTEALFNTDGPATTTPFPMDAQSNVCGVVSLLECCPLTPWHRLNKRQKKTLRQQLQIFNAQAQKVRQEKSMLCNQPSKLPLRLHPSTRMFFAYEVTRIAFCVDASPSLTSTFGVTGGSYSNKCCCPLDNLPEMARTFFRSLVEPVASSSLQDPGIWRPKLAVSVLAVYPVGKTTETSLLVRDYRVDDLESAQILADRIEEWCKTEVEMGIAERISRRREANNTWAAPLYSSSLRDILEAADYALSVLSSEARPCIVVATDGRSVSCDGIMDVFVHVNRVDIPIVVLDVSNSETHIPFSKEEQPMQSMSDENQPNFLTYDPGGPSAFPLHLSDDTEALYGVCRSTGGCFLDAQLLAEAAQSTAGQQVSSAETPLSSDHYHSFKRRFVKMNGIQWLTLFSLSPLSPTFHSSWGKLVPPGYLKRRLSIGMVDAPAVKEVSNGASLLSTRHESFCRQGSDLRPRGSSFNEFSIRRPHAHNHNRVTFSTYVVSPIRIKGLLLMRIKEGYRAKQYGQSTQDSDKVFIQFTLPLELGTILHYELSYKALPNQNRLVGSAHVKIELSGDPGFIQSVKNDFLRQFPDGRPLNMAQKVSAKLCTVLHWIRKEDCLQSYLCPPLQWSDQLSSPDVPFVRRLGTLFPIQRRRHFQVTEFDVVCTGRMPYAYDDDDFLSEFMAGGNGEQELVDAISEWSTQTITEKSKYIKRTDTSDDMNGYCVIEIRQSPSTSRLFTISVETKGGSNPGDRQAIIASLKAALGELKDVEVLVKQMGPFLIGAAGPSTSQSHNVALQYHHSSWDLIKDPELLPLLMKRRTEIGNFRLLESSDDHAIFAKVVPEVLTSSPGDLVQYQFAIMDDKVVIDIQMECECGTFFPFRLVEGSLESRFHRMVHILRRRDQECGRALRSRTNLLQVFKSDSDSPPIEEAHLHLDSVKRLLAYSSRVSRKLRFFNANAGVANDILFQIAVNLLLSESLGARAAKLAIDPEASVKDNGPGEWFILQFDRHTMSLVHLSLDDEVGGIGETTDCTFRELTFFTIGISDLYSKRDDIVDDDSVNSHISEYLCVTEFADLFEAAQKKNLSAAAYLALRSNAPPTVESFEEGDFAEVLSVCKFVEVASVLIPAVPPATDTETVREDESKLAQVVRTLLRPVPGNQQCLFYCGTGDVEELMRINANDTYSLSSVDGESEAYGEEQSANGEDDLEADENRTHSLDDGLISVDSYSASLDADLDAEPGVSNLVSPPIFVKFTLDGKPATVRDIYSITKSTNLALHISVFESSMKLTRGSETAYHPQIPWSHQTVGLEITTLLKSYVAEQTIERLRHVGSSISNDDLKLVMTCLNRVRSVVLFSTDVYFYVSKTDLMVPSSAPAGGESEVEEGFQILNTELRNNGTFNLKPVTGGGFIVADTVSSHQALECWCFVKVSKSEGLVSAQAYHPEGEQKATEVMSNINAVVRSCVHRVNQQLLLKCLHGSRTASSLLLVDQDKKTEGPEERVAARFYPGVFKCPIVFRTVFDLYHRCATNPNQVARTLEATVLHSFAVSNRRGIFVYKDETGAIFYMSLQATGSGNDADGQIELLVHGVHEPGPSVTMQLRMLLQRRLLLIAVDMLSSVLTKNPHFNWKQADLDFIRSFETEWTSLEENSETTKQDCIYEFPSHVYDPLLVLLMFRQNICGSTFFHPVHDTGGEAKTIPLTSATEDHIPDAGGVVVDFNKKDFTLYYNNAASKLDPAFQGVSTLTEKGANYCRLGGTGIAIIEFSLVYSDGTPIKKIKIGQPANSEDSVISVPIEALRFRSIDHFAEGGRSFCVKVRVIDTSLKREYLHEWIALTLHQALIGWVIERQIERSRLGILRPLYEENKKTRERRTFTTDIERKSVVDFYSPGLPALNSVLESSHDLPHPAVAKIHNEGVIRSSSVATATLEFLENCVLPPILSESKAPITVETAKANMTIVRLSRSEKPRLVKLVWDKARRHALVSLISGDTTNTQAMIRDSPIDCPEYICLYCVNEYGSDQEDSNSPPKVYREVVLDDRANERSTCMAFLQESKKMNPRVFRRSFAFIFSVKRNRRSLWAYNWTPQVLKSVATQLNETDRSALLAAGRSTAALQLRSLRILSPDASRLQDTAGTRKAVASKSSKAPSPKSKKQSVAPEAARNADPDNRQKDAESRDSETGPTRKIRRPTNMRRPKLIGKSVEGAAMQAVAASRTRASTNRFKTPPPPPQPKRPPRESGPARDIIKAAPLRKPAPQSDSSLTESSRSAQGFRSQKEPQKRDDILSRVSNDFRLLSSSNASITRRLSSLQREALLALSNVWWPRKDGQTIPKTVGEFLLSKSPITWSDACFIPPLPTRMSDIFPLAFSNWIAAWTPGLDILPLPPTNSPSKLPDYVLLSSEIKNVRGCKCLAVVRITKVRGSKTGRNKAIVRCEGWVLNLPRRSRMDQVKRLDSNAASMLSKENDSAGMDKLASDLHGSIVLRSLLFDFSASIVERTIRLLDTKVDYKELIPIVRTLMARYPYEHQKRMPMLNYRAFEATLKLKSYRDRLIDMFDATTLFERLFSEADERDVVRCGVGLCFKKGISVRGCHSLCFLTRHPSDVNKMQLVILCRTQGRDLAEFMFREGSDVAIHILDNIAVEAASLAYKELRFVSEKLRKDALWKSLASKEPKKFISPEQGIKEMLDLTTVRPLSQLLGNHFIGTSPELATLLGPDSGIDWAMCTLAMKKDAAFSPNWSLEGEDEFVTSLFYSQAEDLFWLIRLDLKGKLLRADLVEKNELVESERRQMALQKFSNFLLHYIWHNL